MSSAEQNGGESLAPPPQSAPPRPKRPWRDNLEAFGMAILMAVLLKPMVIEAYQIPTSSMQPTLMGSAEAAVHDRILVDKIRFKLFEPKRGDIVVFRYPIRRNQNYVKRIVGVPGDRLRIAGGNIFEVGQDGVISHVHRKPDRIQDGLWKEIYPARRYLEESDNVFDYFEGQWGDWRMDGEDMVVKASPRGRSRLSFTDLGHNGLSNQIYDGYPTDIARAIRDEAPSAGEVGVQDVRIGFALTPTADVTSLEVALQIRPPGLPAREYRLSVENAVGRLQVLVSEEKKSESDPFDCALGANTTAEIGFAHIDDRLVAFVDGGEIAALEVGAHRVTSPLEPRHLLLAVQASGGQELRFADLTVDRDLHYVPTGLGDDPKMKPLLEHVIEVPEGHYFMMGDNTLASADSRQWKSLTLGEKDGWLVDPGLGDGEVRLLRGNKRPWSLQTKPDVDENPVIVHSGNPQIPDDIVFTDDNGEVFRLKGKIGRAYAPDNMTFKRSIEGSSAEWVPPEEHVYFVPREHILGRPVAGFWPIVWPARLGFIR